MTAFLADAQILVTKFHKRIGAPVAASPDLLRCEAAAAARFAADINSLSKKVADAADGTKDLLLSRTAMDLEELGEWLAAHAESDLAAAGDALADRTYMLVGDAVATGLPLDKLFAEVHRSNMNKLLGVTTGNGKAGTFGVPGLSLNRPLVPGESSLVKVTNLVPGSSPALLWGLQSGTIAFDDGTIYMTDPRWMPLPTVSALGQVGRQLTIPDDADLYGLMVYFQAIVLDPVATGPFGTAQSRRLAARIGF